MFTGGRGEEEEGRNSTYNDFSSQGQINPVGGVRAFARNSRWKNWVLHKKDSPEGSHAVSIISKLADSDNELKEMKFSAPTEQCRDPSLVTVAPLKMFIRLYENSSDLSIPRYLNGLDGSSFVFVFLDPVVSFKSSLDHSIPKILFIWRCIPPRLCPHPAVVSQASFFQHVSLVKKICWLTTHLTAAAC